jgi:hypothetical protein
VSLFSLGENPDFPTPKAKGDNIELATEVETDLATKIERKNDKHVLERSEGSSYNSNSLL